VDLVLTYPELPLADSLDLRLRASRNRQARIVVRPLGTGSFFVALLGLSGVLEAALKETGEQNAIRAFGNLEECVRAAAEISANGEVFFDRPI
jgi:hypothetical protein